MSFLERNLTEGMKEIYRRELRRAKAIDYTLIKGQWNIGCRWADRFADEHPHDPQSRAWRWRLKSTP